METRKLQQVGGGTYTVSIPKAWAREHGLEAGTDVHLYPHADGSIVVRSSAEDGRALDAVRVDVDGEGPELVTRALCAAHAVGFETVTLAATDAFSDEQRRAARRTKRHLVGTEILEEREDEIALGNLLDAADVSVRQSVVQGQFVTGSILREATTAFSTAAALDVRGLRARADEVDRLFQMTLRHFGRAQTSMEELDRLGLSRPALFDYYATARELQRVAELAVTIGRATERRSEPLPDDLAEEYATAARTAGSAVEEATNAVLEGFDAARVHAVADEVEAAVAAVEATDRAAFEEPGVGLDASGNDVRALSRALDALAGAAEHAGTIAEIAMRAVTRAGCS